MSNPTFPIDTADAADLAPLDDEAVQRRIAHELERRKWRLATEPALFATGDAFPVRVRRRWESWRQEQRRGPDDKLLEQAIVHEYCHLLHAALSQGDGRLQTAAVDETIAYGWPLALSHYPDRKLAEGAILRAVHKVWLAIHKVQPGSYLAFFAQVLLNEIKQDHRKQKRIDEHEQFDAEPGEPGDDTGAACAVELDDPAAAADFERMINRVSAPSLHQLLRDCLKNPRREHIILLHFFLGLNASEVAHHLQMAVAQFYVEKSRALATLKSCCPEKIRSELHSRLIPSF